MRKMFAYATPKIIGAVAVILVLGGYFLFSGSAKNQEIIVVAKKEFLQQVSVSGKVIAAQDVDLGFTQSGRVSHVYAKVGDTIAAGALLAEIENGDLYAAVLQKQASLDSQRAKLEALTQGTRPEEIAVAESNVESAQVTLAQANAALLNAIRDAYTTSDDAVRNELYQFISNPRSINPQVSFSSSDSQLAVQLVNKIPQGEARLTDWSAQVDTVSTDNLSVLVALSQANLSFISSMLSDAGSLLTKAIPNPGISQTTINGYVSGVAVARGSLDTTTAALTTALTAQKSAVSALNTAQKNLSLKQAGTIQADIDAQAAQVAAAEADLASARAQLAKTRIVAPFTGVVTTMDAKVGAIISPNTPEISMIGSGLLQVETYIPEVSIVNVAVGQMATTTLDAYGEEVSFAAKVVSIDPAETIKSGISTYKTVLEFSQPDERIRPGMTANVTITTGTIPDAIVVPQGAIFERGGIRYVQVLVGKESQDREITTGVSSPVGSVVVTSGLNEGDTVLLIPTS